MTTFSLLVPFRDDPPGRRTRIWDWCQQRWAHQWPQAQIIVCSNDDIPFNKPSAVNTAAEQATGDILAVLDADIAVTKAAMGRLIDAAAAGEWATTRTVARLSEAFTDRILDRDPTGRWLPPTDSDVDKTHQPMGGLQVMPRDAFLEVGGMDTRFQGWGGEDVAFGRALDTLWGTRVSTDDTMYHLWHGDQIVRSRRVWDGQSDHNDQLTRAYQRAAGDPAAMRTVLTRRAVTPPPVGAMPRKGRRRVRLLHPVGRHLAGAVLNTTHQQADAWLRNGTAEEA